MWMNTSKKVTSYSKLTKIVNKLTFEAKNKKMIKSLNDAFKSNPVSEEIHRGKKEYFSN